MHPLRTRNNNRIVVDLNKVQWAKFWYQNQFGDKRYLKPRKVTSRGLEFDADAKHMNLVDTMEMYALRNNLVDEWLPVCYMKVTANSSLLYAGDKAQSIWREWNKRQFKKKQ